jgi:hypothetical protein
MRKSLLLKAVVCGIILLFVGTTVSGMNDISKKSNNNPLASLSSGLEGYWTFNDKNNLGFDNSGNNHQGIPYGVTWTSSGKVSGATSYAGQGYVSLTDFTASDSQGTVCAWVKQTLPSGHCGLIYAEGAMGNNKPYIGLGFNGSRLIFARDVYGTNSNYQGKVDVGANDGNWHFVVYTCDGSSNRFYFDGNEVTLTWQDGHQPYGIWFSSQSTDTNSIGLCNRPDHWGFFTGTIDEVRIYDGALSQAEITNLYTVLLASTMKGGLGITLNVKNVGTATASNVSWDVLVTGGAFGKLNIDKSGAIASVAPGASQAAKSGMFFGLGLIQIKAQVGDEIISAAGSQYFIFTKINK